jgi:hypothetical protein
MSRHSDIRTFREWLDEVNTRCIRHQLDLTISPSGSPSGWHTRGDTPEEFIRL